MDWVVFQSPASLWGFIYLFSFLVCFFHCFVCWFNFLASLVQGSSDSYGILPDWPRLSFFLSFCFFFVRFPAFYIYLIFCVNETTLAGKLKLWCCVLFLRCGHRFKLIFCFSWLWTEHENSENKFCLNYSIVCWYWHGK